MIRAVADGPLINKLTSTGEHDPSEAAAVAAGTLVSFTIPKYLPVRVVLPCCPIPVYVSESPRRSKIERGTARKLCLVSVDQHFAKRGTENIRFSRALAGKNHDGCIKMLRGLLPRKIARPMLMSVLQGLTGRRGEGRSVFSVACCPWYGWFGFALDFVSDALPSTRDSLVDPPRTQTQLAHKLTSSHKLTSYRLTRPARPGQAPPLVSLLCSWPRHVISGKLSPGICSGRRVPSCHHQLIGTLQRETASVRVPVYRRRGGTYPSRRAL